MTRRISEKTKKFESRGTGSGAAYKPWINVAEFPGHLGVLHNPVDWKHGRQMQLLSDGELWQYLILRWDDNVMDVREQYPLDIEVTEHLFSKYKGFRHPFNRDGLCRMTSDLLVDYCDGHQEVYSVKYSLDDIKANTKAAENTAKKLWIEKQYWEGREVKWNLVFTNEMNRSYAENIAQLVYYWKPETVTDKVSLFKFLVAHKHIEIDIKTHPVRPLEYKALADIFIKNEDLSRILAWSKIV